MPVITIVSTTFTADSSLPVTAEHGIQLYSICAHLFQTPSVEPNPSFIT